MTLRRVQRFYEAQAPLYDATRRWVLPGRDRAHALLKVNAGHRVIDFACGTGLNFPALIRAGASEIIGVDLSPAMLSRAQRKCPGARLVQGDLSTIDLEVAADRALCTYGLSLIQNPARALERMAAHLKADGVLVVLDFHELDNRLAPARGLWRAWLRRFHVRDDVLTLVPAMNEMFHDVHVETHALGACAILYGSRPRRGDDLHSRDHPSGTIS